MYNLMAIGIYRNIAEMYFFQMYIFIYLRFILFILRLISLSNILVYH